MIGQDYDIGLRIKRLRETREMSQEEFAQKLNISRQAVSNWERGKSLPDITMIHTISNFFLISAAELLETDISKLDLNKQDIYFIVECINKYNIEPSKHEEEAIQLLLKQVVNNKIVHHSLIGITTFTGIKPKTLIFENAYCELETMRILAKEMPSDRRVKELLEKKKEELKNTCYGNFCPVGECFEASIAALRFITNSFSKEDEWIEHMKTSLLNHINDRKRAKSTTAYISTLFA